MKLSEMFWDVGAYTNVIAMATLGGIFSIQHEWFLASVCLAGSIFVQGTALLLYTELKRKKAALEAAYAIAMQGLEENIYALNEAQRIIAENKVANEDTLPI